MLSLRGLWTGVIAIVFGVLVIAVPDMLRWLIGILAIVIGIIAIVNERKSRISPEAPIDTTIQRND